MKQHKRSAPADSPHRQGLRMQRNNGQRITELERNKDIFGASIYGKPDNAIQVGFKNIHGFPNLATQQVKYDVLRAESRENGLILTSNLTSRQIKDGITSIIQTNLKNLPKAGGKNHQSNLPG